MIQGIQVSSSDSGSLRVRNQSNQGQPLVRIMSEYPPEEEKKHRTNSEEIDPNLIEDEYSTYKEDRNQLVNRLQNIQQKEEKNTRKKIVSRELLQKNERDKAMDHLLQLRRNNLMNISSETDVQQEKLEALYQR